MNGHCGSGRRGRWAESCALSRLGAAGIVAACICAFSCREQPAGSVAVGRPPEPSATAVRLEGRLVFQSRIEGLWQIVLLDLRTGARTRIGRSASDDTYPVFSPDGGWVAFESSRDGTPAVYRMRLDGSSVERLTAGARPCRSPAWAPGGNELAYDCTANGREDIYALELATGRERRITAGPWRSALPGWSPDGSRIAFTCNRLGWDVFVMNADGSGASSLTSRGGNCRPAWSPDGRRIAYVSDAADGKGDVWTMDPDGGNQVRLTLDAASYDYDPAWSPDGAWVVYQRATDKKRGPWGIWAVPAAGGEPIPLTPAGADERFPDWTR